MTGQNFYCYTLIYPCHISDCKLIRIRLKSPQICRAGNYHFIYPLLFCEYAGVCTYKYIIQCSSILLSHLSDDVQLIGSDDFL